MIALRLASLSEWISATLPEGQPVTVSGAFRADPSGPLPPLVPLFELADGRASTVRILLPADAPLALKGAAAKPDNFSHSGNDDDKKDGSPRDWWNGWAAIFAATSLVPPLVDPVVFAGLLHEKRRLRFCCDTNALARGVAAWALNVFDGRADLVTSAVVDRELYKWGDNDKLREARTLKLWSLRTQYRLARRLTEAPLPGVVIDRLAPEHSALMLAKLRDEQGTKSPDADMLLIEGARGLIRDQPRNARVVYLTGDREHARAASNALGSDNVLYACADQGRAKQHQQKILARGWWSPEGGPLGSILAPGIDRFLWDCLAACDVLRLDCEGRAYALRHVYTIPNGAPSDWADPWLSVEGLPPVQPITITCDAEKAIEAEAKGSPAPELPISSSAEEWLLEPRPDRPALEVSASWRPTPPAVFGLLQRALWPDAEVFSANEEILDEAKSILVGLGALESGGGPGPRIDDFRRAWHDNDRDWFHAELLRLPGYRAALDHLRRDAGQPSRRQEAQIAMARTLGQVARAHMGGHWFVGDAAVSAGALTDALLRWLPEPGNQLSVEHLCELAAKELSLTPARFELALERLWRRAPSLPLEPGMGGTVQTAPKERVVCFSARRHEFIVVTSGALSFGGGSLVRFLQRTP